MSKFKLYTPTQNQGQMVVTSYGMWDGMVYRCRYDQSDKSTEYAVARAKNNDHGDYWNGPPNNKRWRTITEEEFERVGSDD